MDLKQISTFAPVFLGMTCGIDVEAVEEHAQIQYPVETRTEHIIKRFAFPTAEST
jgi:hypothetical protein